MGNIYQYPDLKDQWVNGYLKKVPCPISRTGYREVFIGQAVTGVLFTEQDICKGCSVCKGGDTDESRKINLCRIHANHYHS